MNTNNQPTHTALRVAYHRLALLARRGLRACLPFGKTALICALATYLAAPQAFAATITRADNSDTLNLSTAWTGGIAPTSADIAQWSTAITAGVNDIVAIGDNVSWLGIRIGAVNTAITIGATAGKTLTLGTSGIDVTNSPVTLTINADMILAGAQIWNNTNASALTVNGAVDNGGFTLTVASGAGGTFFGASSAMSGAGGLTKTGTGVLTLAGANTYSGNTTISAGTLALTGGSAISDSGNVILATTGSATLLLNSSETIGSLSGGGVLGGTVDLGANTLTVAGATNLNYNGVIIGAGGKLIRSGTGVLGLFGVNTFTGGVTVNSGTLGIGNAQALGTTAGTFVLNGGAIDNISGAPLTLATYPVNINGDFAFVGANGTSHDLNLGTGAITLGTTGPAGARTITTTNGTLTLAGIISDGTATGLIKAGNGTLALTAANNFSGKTTVTGGNLSISSDGNLGPAPGIFTADQLTLNGGALRNTATLSLAANRGVTVGASGGTFNVDGSTTLTVPVVVTGAGGLSKTGAGTLNLSAANNFSGSLTVNQGTLNLSGANTYGGSTIVNGGTLVVDPTVNPTVISSGSGLVLGGSTGGTFQLQGVAASSQSQTLNGLTVNSGASVVDVNNLGTATTLDLRGAGTAVMTRTVGGTVDFMATTGGPLTASSSAGVLGHLSGGGTGIIGGWATINGGADLAYVDGSEFVVANPTYTDIDARGPASTIVDGTANNVRINTAGTAGTIALGSATVNINTLMQNTTTAGTVDTAGKILRLGTAGAILLTPSASSSGSLTIGSAVNDGVLTAGGNTDGVAGSLIFNNNSTADLVVNALVSDNVGGVVSLTKSGAGPLTLAAANTFTGGVVLNGGTLNLKNWVSLGTGAFTVNGGTIDNTASTVVFTTNNQPMTINGDFAFTGTQNLTFSSNAITLGTAAGTSRTITVNAGKLTLNGWIADGTTANSLVKAGNGELILGTTNAYTGSVTINAGTLTIAAGQAYGGGLTLNSGGTLNLNSSFTLGATGSTFTINGGTIDSTRGSVNNIANTNRVTINGDFAFTGTQNVSLGNGNTSLGTAAGTTRTITVNANTLTLGGSISDGTTATSITKAGNGTLVLSNTTNTFSGNITINAGTLTLSGSNSVVGVVTLNPGATVNINNGNGASLGKAGATFIINGGTIDNTSGSAKTASNNPAITINADFAFAGGGGTTHDVNLGLGAVNLGATAGSRTITVNGNNAGNLGNLTIPGVISDGAGGANSIVKSGVGLLTLTNANLFTGGFTLNAGTVNINNATALGTSAGTFTINGGTVANTSGAAVTLTPMPVVINSDFNFNSTRNLSLGAGATTLGTASGTSRTITTDSATNTITLTLGGAITDGTSATKLIKEGYGALTLSGANGFTGGVTLNNGRLNINNATALGTAAGTFLINGSSIDNSSAAAITLTANQPVTLNSDLTFVGTRALNLGSGAVSLGSSAGTSRTLRVNASTLTLGGIISDGTTATSLVKSGTGNLVLSGANTYSGATVVNGGVLQLNGATSLPGGTDTTVGAGESALSLSGGVLGLGAGDFTRALGTGAGQVQFTTNGGFAAFGSDRNVNLGGAAAPVTWDIGSFVPNGSTLFLGATNADKTVTFQNPIALAGAARTVYVEDGAAVLDASLTGALTGTGSSGLIKSGPGRVSLTAANTYAGQTVINGGTVELQGASGAIASSAGIVVRGAGATLTITNSSAANNGNRLLDTGSVTLGNNAVFNFTNDASATAFSETAGTLNLTNGAATVNVAAATGAGSSTLTFGTINRTTNSTVLFTGAGFGGANPNARVIGTLALSTNNVGGIIPWALIQDGATGVYDLAVGGAGAAPITKYAAYTTAGGDPAWVAANNARPSTLISSATARSVNSLVLDNGINFAGPSADRTVTIGAAAQAGLIVQTGGYSAILTNTGNFEHIFAFGVREAIINTIGTLNIQRANATVFTGSAGLTKTGPGTLVLGTNGGSFVNGITGNLNLNQGTLDVFSAGTAISTFGNMNFNGGQLIIREASTNRNYNNAITINADGGITLDRIAVGSGSIGYGFGAMTNNATNAVFTIAGTASFTGGTQTLSNAQPIVLNAPVTFNIVNNGGTTRMLFTNITDTGSNNVTLRGGGTFTQQSPVVPGTIGWTGLGGLILDSNYTGTATINQTNTFTGPLTVNSGTLAMSGSAANISATVNGGTLTLGGTMGFTAGVTLNGGLLNINTADALGAVSSTLTINGGTFNTSATTSNLNNNPLVINGDSTFLGSNPLDLGTGAATLGTSAGTNRTISAAASTLTLGGNIANGTTATGLIKQGAGTVVLNGANTYTGTVTVNGGTLRAGNNTGLGTTAGGTLVNNGATLDLANGITITGESLTLAGSGMLTSTSGNNFWTGPIGVNNSEFSVTAPSELTLSGVITGTGGVEKTGTGILRIDNAANDYTGTTIVKAGTLIAQQNAPVSANGAFGNSAAAVLLGDNQGTAVAALFANSGVTVSRDVTVQAGSTGVKYLGSDGSTGTATFNGAITLNDNLTLTNVAGGPLVINGLISGVGQSIAKLGTGTATLTAANTASGTLTVSGGDLIFSGANGSITPSTITASSITVNSSLLGTSLQAVNTAAANKQNRLGGNATPITLTTATGNTATLSILNDGSANTFRENLGPLTLAGTGGNIVINTTPAAAGGASQLTFASLTGPGAGFALTFNGSGLAETFNAQNEISFIAAPTLSGGIIPGATINGTDNATVLYDAAANNGAGAYALVISTLYDTNFTRDFPNAHDPYLTPFTTTWLSGVNANPNGPVRLSTQRQINSLKLTYGDANAYDAVNYPVNVGVVDLNGQNLYLESGTLKASLTNQLIEDRVGGGKLITGSSTGPAGPTKNLSINVSTNTGGAPITLTIAAVIADNGLFHANNLLKTGIGTLMLSNNNTYSGDTTITDGTLKLGMSGAIPDGLGKGNVSLTPTAVLDLFGNNETVNGLSGTGFVNNSGGFTSTLTVGGNDVGSTFGGVLQNTFGALALAKTGVGVFILTNASTFSGAVSVNQGVLSARHSTALGSSSGVTVANGAQLQIQGGISVTRPLTLNGLGTNATTGALRSVSGTNVWSGPVTLASASRINSDANFLTLNGGISGAFPVIFGGAGTITNLNGITTGANGIQHDGSGALVLGVGNTYTGNTTNLQGTIRPIAVNVLPFGSGFGNLVLSTNALAARFDLNGFDQTINGVTGFTNATVDTRAGDATISVGAGDTTSVFDGYFTNTTGVLSLTKIGTGTFTITTNYRAAGIITVNNGILRTTSRTDTALGSGAASLVLNGGELQVVSDGTRGYGRNTTVGGNATITSDTATALAGTTKTFGTLSIGANTLTVQDGGTTASGNSGVTFGAVTMTGAATFKALKNNAAAGTILTLGAVNNGGFNLTFDGTGTNVVSGTISGAGGVIKNGAGLASLTATNAYGGDTTVNTGTLRIGIAQAIPNGVGRGNVFVDSLATLDVANANTINGLNGTGLIANQSGTATRVLTVGSNDATSIFSGTLQNGPTAFALGLTKVGLGTLTLSGPSTHTTNTTVSAGTLELTGSWTPATDARLTVSAGATLNESTIGSIAGAASLIVTGTAVLSNANTYTGGTTNAGFLRLEHATALPGGIAAAGGTSGLTFTGGILGLTATSGDFLRAAGTGISQVQWTAAGGFAAFGGDRIVNLGGLGTPASVQWAAAGPFGGTGLIFSTNTSDSTVTFQNPIDMNAAVRTVTVNDGSPAVDAIMSGIMSGASSGLTKGGAGTLQLTAVNSYTGGTIINAGTLQLSGSGTLASQAMTVNSGTLDLNGLPLTVTTLGLGGAAGTTAAVTTGAGTLTLGGTVTFTGTGTPNGATISGTVAMGGASRTFAINDSTAATDDLTVNAAITGTGANTITKTGAGTLVLGGANTYGSTIVRVGTLKLGANDVLPTDLTLQARVGDTVTMDLNGKTDTVTALTLGDTASTTAGSLNQLVDVATGGLLKLGGNVTYNTGAATFENGTATVSAALDLNGATRTFLINDSPNTTQETVISGAIQNSSGTGGLTKTGAGVLVLSGLNTYNGDTTITLGTVKLGTANVIPNGASKGNVSVTGTLDLAGNSETINGLSGTGTVDGTSGTPVLTVGDGDATSSFDGLIKNTAGVLALAKIGAGTLSLSTANTFSGNVSAIGGVLRLLNSGALGTGTGSETIVIDNGATLDLSGSVALAPNKNLELRANGGSAILSSSSGNNSWSGGTITVFNSPIDVAFGSVLSLSSQITGGGGVEKIDDGTLVLTNAANNYTGVTTVEAGTLVAAVNAPNGSAGAFGNATSAILLGNTTGNSNATLLAGDGVTVGRDVTVQSGSSGTKSAGAFNGSGTATFSGAFTIFDHLTLTAPLGGTADFTGAITESGGAKNLTATGGGKVRLSAANAVTGSAAVNSSTTLDLNAVGALGTIGSLNINGGTLLLSGGSSGRISSTAPVTVNNGKINSGGNSETFGTLTMTTSSIIDFGVGISILNFANSSAASWTGTLSIWNWSGNALPLGGGGTDQLIFGNNGSALTAGQVAQIYFYSDSGVTPISYATILGNGEVVPVPEPATVIALAALAGLLGWRERRRIKLVVDRVRIACA